MTDLPFLPAEPEAARSAGVTERRCRRHRWFNWANIGDEPRWKCLTCDQPKDEVLVRRNKNNRARGGKGELDVAKVTGGRKVGPMGWPWDVELPGYARLQVRKLKVKPSLNEIIAALDAISKTPGPEMAGYVYLEPGRNGEQLIVFRLREFVEHHGDMKVEEAQECDDCYRTDGTHDPAVEH